MYLKFVSFMKYVLFVIAILVIAFRAGAAERDIIIRNASAGIDLAGTLAVPDDVEPRAILVLATGSGAQNRDEEVFGLRPFKTLSDSLVEAGYGVLRMDDRGTGQSEGDFESALLDDLKSDVLAGVESMRSTFPDTKVGILGHSQGGQLAIKAAAEGNADFIVTMAAPAWKGDSLIMSQCRALAVATTGSWPGERLERDLLDIAMSDLPEYIAAPLLLEKFLSTLGPEYNIEPVRSQIMAQVRPMLSAAYREMLRYDPAEDIKGVRVPWIALNGDRDLQVVAANLDTIKELNPQTAVISLPGHNHLFQQALTGLPTEYATAGQTPSDMTLTLLTAALDGLFDGK